MNKGNILIVDDEVEIRNVLSRILQLEGHLITIAENIEDALKILSEDDIQVLILDVKLKNINSLNFLVEIRNLSPLTEIIMLTAFGKIADGVQAIKQGAFEYIVKGDDDEKFIPTVEKALEKNRLATQLHKLQKKISNQYSFENITGQAAGIKEAISLAKKLSASDTTLLLKGETGTGKEVFAQSIHYNSKRADKQFVAINCGAIPNELLESELFGYKKGAFTGANSNKKGLFEEANGGTLFLDEISEMVVNQQTKLLRVLESKSFIKPGDSKETTVDVRIIAATNTNLEKAIEVGTFRKDLYYRITAFIIELPSLRERKEDIQLLAEYFIKLFSARLNKPVALIDDDFYSKLLSYNFPGNIRELKNVCERVVILSENGKISPDYLPQEFFYSSKNVLTDLNDLSIAAVEKEQIKKILLMTRNNKIKSAEILGIGLTTLYRKIEQYNLD